VVPVPEESAFPAADAEAAIQRATSEADERGIRGKAVTPFLLQRVAELTGGAARTANSALLVNSARHAALVARALSAMPTGSTRSTR
jgi:pseudouridine-5'-phosphate glycosidase